MSAGLTGDFGALDAVIREVQSFADGTRTRKAVGRIGSEISTIVRESIDSQRTPEGVPWKPRANPRARGRTLNVSGRLRASAVRMVFSGLTIRIDLVRYGGWQNDGTLDGHVPARPFLPSTPLSPAIQARLRDAALSVLR